MADEPDDEIDDDDDPPRFKEVWSALIEGSHEDKVRPVVVMFTAEDFAEVVYGSSKPHPKKLHIAVKADIGKARRWA
jgi:hypothetical protein